MKAIVIDAGHGLTATGGPDVGAKASGTTERAEVVGIAKKLMLLLSGQQIPVIGIGIDQNLSLIEKISRVNRLVQDNHWDAEDVLLVSIHLNSGASLARGLEAWYSPKRPDAKDLGHTILTQLAAATGMPLRNPSELPSTANRHTRLGILDDVSAMAVLIECGFLSNALDAPTIKRQQPIADGLYQGIQEILEPSQFRDVSPTDWFFPGVQECLKAGVVEMPVDRKFHPDRPVTRAEMATMLARLLRR